MSYKFNDSFVDKIDEIQDIALQIYGKYDLESKRQIRRWMVTPK